MQFEQAVSSTCCATRRPAAPQLGLSHAALLAKEALAVVVSSCCESAAHAALLANHKQAMSCNCPSHWHISTASILSPIQVFIQKSAVNLLSTVLDTPEFFWSAPDSMQALYKRVCEYMELDDRVEVLNNRFTVRGSACVRSWGCGIGLDQEAARSTLVGHSQHADSMTHAGPAWLCGGD